MKIGGSVHRRLRGRRRAALMVAIAAGSFGVVIAVNAAGALDGAELSSLDLRFRIRETQTPRRDVVLVAVDNRTLSALNRQPPYPRSVHARMIELLHRAGARVIAYDIQFLGTSTPQQDHALIEAVKRARPVLLATHDVNGPPLRIPAGVRNPGRIGAVLGSVGVPSGVDKVVRQMLYAPINIVSFDVLAAQLALGHPVRQAEFPGDYAWIDFAGPPSTVPTYSFSDVLRGRVPLSRLRGNVVIVGYTDPILQDIFKTPISDNYMSGPEIHANSIATILDGFPLRSAPEWLNVLLVIAAASLVPLVNLRYGGAAAAAAGVAGLVLLLLGLQVAFNEGRIVNVTKPVLALVLSAVATVASGYVLETRERRRLRLIFSRFVPEDVVDDVINRTDDDLRLGGVRLDSTVVFTDLRGFTSFSEELEPERVVAVVNHYLEGMTEAILAHGGTLVSYMGDGIMALFGAPLEQPDHADRALKAVSEMLTVRLPAFNAWLADNGFEKQFRMGIGINSGPVMSGNVGSSRRLEYTALGDTTNTAARLEAMTKDTAHQVLISDATRQMLQVERSDLVREGQAPVRGRAEAVELWTFRVPG
ncbi:MAG: CHASE2 domain-containing protein [Solirubrobacteraceae bacterium]